MELFMCNLCKIRKLSFYTWLFDRIAKDQLRSQFERYAYFYPLVYFIRLNNIS